MLRLGTSAVILYAALSAFGGCTLLLDFDAPIVGNDATIDSGTADAAVDAMVDAQTVFNCLVAEPNDDHVAAIALAEGALNAALCPGTADDLDYYSFAVAADTDVILSLTFDDSIANLVLTVYNSSDMAIVQSSGTNSPAIIERTLAQTSRLPLGTYQVRVASTNSGTRLDYQLTLDRTPDPL